MGYMFKYGVVLIIILLLAGAWFALKPAPIEELVSPEMTYVNASEDIIHVISPTAGESVGSTFTILAWHLVFRSMFSDRSHRRKWQSTPADACSGARRLDDDRICAVLCVHHGAELQRPCDAHFA
jgi:hypothetical protein